MIIFQFFSKPSKIKQLRTCLVSLSFVFLILSGLLILAETTLPLSGQDWIILPDLVNPYMSPSFDAAKAEVVFKYLEQIKEIDWPETNPSSSSDWICFECEEQILYLPQALLVQRISLSTSISQMNVDKFNPLPLNYSPEDLMEIDQKWNFHASDYPKYLRAEAAEALGAMLQDAEEMGIHLRVFLAFRSFEKQRTLYLNAIEKQGLKQEWVAKPAHSEHQLGTTVDLCSPDPRGVGHQNFYQSKEGQWLQAHAQQYGFKQSYTRDNVRFTGYQSEPWHYRFVGLH